MVQKEERELEKGKCPVVEEWLRVRDWNINNSNTTIEIESKPAGMADENPNIVRRYAAQHTANSE